MTTQRILQNNRLLWLDVTSKDDDADTQHTIDQLKIIVYHVDLFTQIDDCVRFLDKVKNERVLIITSESLVQQFVQQTHH